VVTVIPVGFILTELVSNSLKHAFPDGRSGEIFVGLAKKNRPEFEIIVSDNGVGIPEDVDLKNPKSLGLDLVITFVDQLKGRIEVESLNGVTVRILCNATELSKQ
jgi:two-component sensor histidine kinase